MTRIFTPRRALLITALATVLVAAAVTSARASAIPFCGGQRVNNVQSCFGTPRTVTNRIQGVGETTGVCVGYNEVVYAACSPHAWAGEWAVAFISGYVQPRIIGQSRTLTFVGGETI